MAKDELNDEIRDARLEAVKNLLTTRASYEADIQRSTKRIADIDDWLEKAEAGDFSWYSGHPPTHSINGGDYVISATHRKF